jgi:heterodisulfide reductase subunit A-like polyferredoxin
MKTVKEKAREIPVLYEADVVVVGGGPAGIGAALASGKIGARTVLIERFNCLGYKHRAIIQRSPSLIPQYMAVLCWRLLTAWRVKAQ